MKYWNKDKKVRVKWATSPSPKISSVPNAKNWCKNNASTGKFYFHYTNTRWWFEHEHDATLFALAWSNR